MLKLCYISVSLPSTANLLLFNKHRNHWARVGAQAGGMSQHFGQGTCLSLLICAGRGRSAPRSAASAWWSLCLQTARPTVLSKRTDLLMLSPNLMQHHLTRSNERWITRRLTAGLVRRYTYIYIHIYIYEHIDPQARVLNYCFQ